MTQQLVHVAVFDTLADWEVGLAIAHINNPAYQRNPGSYRVVTVGETHQPVTTMGGMRVLPDATVDEMTPSDSAMLILPGGTLWDEGGNQAFARKARQFVEAGVPVAAICGATAGLAREGLLDDRDHTSNAAEYLAATGYSGAAHYREDVAVTDRNVITASSMAVVEFACEVFQRLDVYQPEVLNAWYLLFGRQDPSGFAAMIGDAAEPTPA